MRIYMPRQAFIENLKDSAKAEKRASSSSKSLSFYLDKVAGLAGFQSWGRFHNNLQVASSVEFDNIHDSIGRAIGKALPNAAPKYVERVVIGCISSEFERCESFSEPRASRENGYSHPSASVDEVARELFSNIYPEALLNQAIARLMDLGPWCEDDSEIMFEYEF